MQARLGTLFLLTLVCTAACAKPAPDWVTTRYGRAFSEGFYSVNKNDCSRFVPSGKLDSTIKHNNLTINIYHGVYYSDQENPDTSKDEQASVEVLQGDQRVFVARGYKFSEIGLDSLGYKTNIRFTHWTGVMGDEQILVFAARYQNQSFELQSVSKHSTKEWTGLIAGD